ncbi:heme-binding protein [Palleronia sp.]|uniref:GlcG/HbpS family heme-binding protein n=1 Tax=Palleronia sp. TaxID=1940284 RepID=UPI0035C7FBDA
MTLKLDQARAAIRGTFDAGGKAGMKPLSAIVLDAGGNVLAFERQDGSSPGKFAIAHGKAYGAVMLGMPSSAMMERAEKQPYFVAALNGAYGGAVIPVPGGILIMEGETVIGALGVTGDTSDNDVTAGMAGLATAGLAGAA